MGFMIFVFFCFFVFWWGELMGVMGYFGLGIMMCFLKVKLNYYEREFDCGLNSVVCGV